MPYITQDRREVFNPIIDQLQTELAKMEADNFDSGNNTEGNINYIFTKLLLQVYAAPLNYGNINDAVGILENVKLEFYRRYAGPYEDKKAAINGDV